MQNESHQKMVHFRNGQFAAVLRRPRALPFWHHDEFAGDVAGLVRPVCGTIGAVTNRVGRCSCMQHQIGHGGPFRVQASRAVPFNATSFPLGSILRSKTNLNVSDCLCWKLKELEYSMKHNCLTKGAIKTSLRFTLIGLAIHFQIQKDV